MQGKANKMNKNELKQILKNHIKWLKDDEPDGMRTNLSGVDLSGADLYRANFSKANLSGAYFRGANFEEAILYKVDFKGADLSGANLRRTDLNVADLTGADLNGADLTGANLDYSCLPLWCGSFDMKVDKRIAAQICYHFCRLDCDDEEYLQARAAVKDFANTFHRVDECGEID